VGPQPYLWCRSYDYGPTELKMFQEKISKRKEKKIIFYFLFLYLKIFQSHRARNHTFGADGMVAGPLNM
jgi:hypothetical protein